MKSILYVGATLMIGASIYGFVDYQKTSHKKEFGNMYKEQEVAEPATTTTEVLVPAESKTAVVTEKKAATKKNVTIKEKEEIVPGIQPISDDAKLIASETKIIGTETVTITPSKESTKSVKKKKRKLSSKLFSRGALDERYIKEEVLIEPVKKTETTKTESVKTENKEQ